MHVTYRLDGPVATITMDDGKVNVLSLAMQQELNTALHRAAADEAVVVLTGRPGRFSAGFDLGVLTAGGPDARAMLRGGYELAARLFSFPSPVVIACTGHALAMGSFLLLAADYRIGAAGTYKIGANEVAIGLTMPATAIELCRQRLTPPYLHRAVNNAEIFTPETAIAAGWLDRVVPAEELATAAAAKATELAGLNRPAHTATKLRLRAAALTSINAAIEADDAAVAQLLHA
jgi:enoyl-CoA hydratase